MSSTKAPFTNPPVPPPAGTTPPAVLASSPKAKDPGFSLLRGSLPRIVGYGLLGLFALDLAQVLANYKPFAADSDAGLVVQIIERVGVPLVAYALIFATNTGSAERRERTVLKLLSIGALVAMVVYVGLGALSITSAVRLSTRGGYVLDRQTQERVNALEQALKQVPTAQTPQLLAVYRSIVPAAKPEAAPPSHEELVTFVGKHIPSVIASTREAAATARAALIKQQVVFGAKYGLGGLLAGLLFLVIWENTRSVRAHTIFNRRSSGAPSMKLEDKLVGGFQTLQTRMEEAFFLPSLEKYRWYRRLRRFFGGRR